ncbi:equilibrative nucleoside transporter 1-like [Octopus vulgaris]|uniref:Equilibrative nucleoside transporter 1-like n=1 Tax=Octopus vulgaris TaxID=6645 RepID=A0AA36FM78_OCTVU|nr:equilibrative nucleoside transporter 1-like [Octopus vulgaris]
MMKRNVDDDEEEDEEEYEKCIEMQELSLEEKCENISEIAEKAIMESKKRQQSLSSINLDGSNQNLIKLPYLSGNGTALRTMNEAESSPVGSLGKTREERIANLECKPLRIQNKTRRPFSEIYAVDRCKVVCFFLMTLGICSALPYNLLVITDTYFEDFLDTHVNATAFQMMAIKTFRPYLLITSKIPVVFIVCFNTYYTNGCCTGLGRTVSLRRLITMIVLMIIASLLLLVFSLVIVQEWMYIFAWLSLVFVIFLNVTGAVFQNSLFGIAFTLPRIYSNAVLIGMSTCGCLCFTVNTILLAFDTPFRYLVLSVFIILILTFLTSLLICYIMKNIHFFDYHIQKVVTPNWTSEISFSIPPRVCRLKFHKKVWLTGFNLCLIHLTTSSSYPTVGRQVHRVNFPFPDKYWTLVFFYLMVNVFSLIGNILGQYLKLMRHRFVWLALLSRSLVFIPYFIFCNYKPEGYGTRTLPVYLENDYMFVLGAILMAFSSGYYTSVCVMYAQYNTNREDCYLSGMLTNTMIYCGMFGGSIISLFFPFLTNDGKSP